MIENKNERLELRIDSKLLERVDEWRGAQTDLPGRSEAIRRLLVSSLGESPSKANFELVRFQIKAAALTPGVSDRIADAYVYAWDASIYPLLHHDELSLQFESHFLVSKELAEELLLSLDKDWLNEKLYTFYELEDHLGLRYGKTDWDRSKLIHTLRYVYLTKAFDDKFWSKLLEPTNHPTEARIITSDFSKSEDIYFS